jgi:WD40 repeat protein
VQRAPGGGFEAEVAISKDGIVATWTRDDTLRLWHLASRSLVRTIPGDILAKGNLVHPVKPVWDETSKEVLLVGGDGVLGVDVNGKQKLRPWAGESEKVQELHATSSGTARWIGLTYGSFRGLDAAGIGVFNLKSPEALGSDLAISNDGKWAIGGADKGIVRFALDTIPATTRVIPLPSKPTARDAVSAGQTLALSPTGDTAYVCMTSGKGEQLLFVSNLSGPPNIRPVKLLDEAAAGCSVAVTADGRLVVAAMGSSLVGIDARTATVRWRAPIANIVTSLAIDARGRTVVAGLYGGTIGVFDARSGNAVGELGESLRAPTFLAFQKNDTLLGASPINSMFGGADRRVALWSLQDGGLRESTQVSWGAEARLAEDGTLNVARSAPSTTCAKNEQTLSFAVGTLANGAPRGEGAGGTWPPAPSRDAILCLPAQSRSVAIEPRGGRVILEQRGAHPAYSVLDARGTSHPLSDVPPGGIGGTMLWFSRDGRWILGAPGVRGSWSNLHVWSALDGAKVGVFTADPADSPGITLGVRRRGYTAEDVSDDGSTLAIGSEDRVTLYELPSKRPIRTVELPPQASLTAVAMAPGPNRDVFAGLVDGTLVVSRENAALLQGESSGGAIKAIQARSDGVRVATVSDDGSLRIWAAPTVEPLAALLDFTDDEYLATTPRGAYAGTSEAADRVRWVFDSPTEGFSFQQFARTFQRSDLLAARLSSGGPDIAETIARPPRVEVVSPPPSRIAASGVSISAHVSSASTVTVLRAFVEGRPVAAKDVGAKTADVTLEIPLLPGGNTVTLVAFDDKGASSNPEAFEITATSATTSPPEVWIVAAGVGRYVHLAPESQLEAAVNDARSIASAFSAQAGPGKPFAKAHTTLLADDEVTPAALLGALSGLAAMKPADLAVVFLAGHGVKPRNKEMVFLTGSATLEIAKLDQASIGWNKIGAALATARGRVLVLVDACNSGHMSQDLIVPNSALADDLVQSQRAGVVVFAASKGRQLSWESGTSRGLVLSPDQESLVTAKSEIPAPGPAAGSKLNGSSPSVGHGYFTGAILRTLQTPSSDVDGDGAIELSELVSQVTLRVSKGTTGGQTPWVARRELFGDFIVARTPL